MKRHVEVIDGVSTQNIEYISLSGKLWVAKSPYDFDIDNFLRDNEELWFLEREAQKYVYKDGDRQVIIKNPLTCINVTRLEAIEAMREFSECLLRKFGGEKITVDEYGIHLDNDFENSVIPECLAVDEELEQYAEDYPVVVTGNYAVLLEVTFPKFVHIEKFKKAIFNKGYLLDVWRSNLTLQNKDLNIKMISKAFSKQLYFVGNTYPVFVSPSKLPENAFPFDGDPTYIQFTRNGLVVSNGTLFSQEGIGKARKSFYIADKSDDGWDIYVYMDSVLDGHYRIVNGKLYKWSTLKGDFQRVEVDGDLKDYIQRDKLIVDGKTMYVPRRIIKNFVHPLL